MEERRRAAGDHQHRSMAALIVMLCADQ